MNKSAKGLGKILGEMKEGKFYKKRPGVYALPVIEGEGGNNDKIGIVKVTPPHRPEGKFHLIGGGVEPRDGFDYRGALKREILEETGRDSIIESRIGVVQEYVNSTYMTFWKVGYFFKVRILNQIQEPIEKDHELIWVDIVTAREILAHQSARFILEFYIKINNILHDKAS